MKTHTSNKGFNNKSSKTLSGELYDYNMVQRKVGVTSLELFYDWPSAQTLSIHVLALFIKPNDAIGKW